MFCKNCGKEIPDNSEFCMSCGVKTKASETPASQAINTAVNTDQAIGTVSGAGAKSRKWYTRPWLYIILAIVIAAAVLVVTGIGADIVAFVVEGPSVPIEFDSAELEDAVRKQLNINADKKITDKNAVGVNELNLEGCGISGIEALAQFKDLTSLNLKGNKISDLSALTALQGLKELDLSDNKISNVEALSDLSSLESVNLSNNQISDISALTGCECLTELSLQNNPVKDIGSASKIRTLQNIDLRGTKVNDISDIAGKVGIKIDKPEIVNINLMPGEYFMIENLKLPLDIGSAKVTWTSSNNSTVTVGEDGKIQTTNVYPDAWNVALHNFATIKGKIENVDAEIVFSIIVTHDSYAYDWDTKKTSYKSGGYKATGYAYKLTPTLENVIGIDVNYDITIKKGKLSKFAFRAAVDGKWKNFGTIDVKQKKEGTLHIDFTKPVKISKYWLVPKEKKSGQWNEYTYIDTIYYEQREADLGDLQVGAK